MKNTVVEKVAVREMQIQLAILVVAAAIYTIGRSYWNPTGFDIGLYWKVSQKGFLETMLPLIPIAMLIHFVMGQLDWLTSDAAERLEVGTSVRSPIWLKLFRSVFAGITEELGYRGIFIYTGMVAIFIVNTHFSEVAVALMALGILLGNRRKEKASEIVLMTLAIFLAYVLIMVTMNIMGQKNPLDVLIIGFYLPVYRWVLSPENRLVVGSILSGLWAAEILYIIISVGVMRSVKPKNIAQKRQQKFYLELHTPGMTLKIILLNGLIFGMLFWIIVQTDPSVVLARPSLEVMAITVAVFSFGRGHRYQGWKGVIGAVAFGWYIQYVAFTYGLLYAMVVHCMYNCTIDISNQLAQSIKDAAKAGLKEETA